MIRQDLVVQYEQLRREAMRSLAKGGQNLGLALFLRRGMKAWMQAWPQRAGNVDPGPRSQPNIDQTVPAGMRSQLAALLAGMILCLQQEATA